MSDFSDKLQVATRAQTALIKAEVKRNKVSAGLLVLCAIFAALSLLALNGSLFFYLTDQTQMQQAALMLFIGNLVLAIVPWVIAQSLKPSEEEKILQDLRDRALDSATAPIGALLSPTKGLGDVAPLIGFALKLLAKK